MLNELCGAVGAPGSTLRARLAELEPVGAIEARRPSLAPLGAEYSLSAAGEALLPLMDVVQRWLDLSPGGGRELGGESARAAIAALCGGWSTMALRPLAARPLSVASLDRLIASLSYPALERRIAAMRLVGQVEALRGGGRETPYAVTEWLRLAVAPLVAAIRWESGAGGERPSPGQLEFETVFLLAAPLLRLAGAESGSCRLAVELGGGDGRVGGALLEIRSGSVIACGSRLNGEAGAWALGTSAAWLDTLVDGDLAALELGGDGALARAVAGGLHRALFVSRSARPLEAPRSRRVPQDQASTCATSG